MVKEQIKKRVLVRLSWSFYVLDRCKVVDVYRIKRVVR